ncbi:hypothetical protein MVEN_01621700 [Mycena venus]|uniref:Alpha-type protein kinase domain-containing protein n=1 Tax=Mycena venus TaxID=2733690 RepID=A0A8H6XSW7_9AGAR|nr:hypothetical protein MVEN_01621700 [Mycena venus]
MSLITDINTNRNSPPTTVSNICPKCHNHTLGSVIRCEAGGTDIQNWDRHLQKCSFETCHYYLWHHPRTPMERIPQEVQLRFAAKASLAEARQTSSKVVVPCGAPNCRDSKGEPRRANSQCDRTPFYCSSCCKALGGCRLPSHRPTTRDVSTRSDTTNSTVSPVDPPRRAFARPLDPSYAQPYIEAHRDRMQASARAEDDAKMKDLEANVFYVAVWTKDAPAHPERFRLVADRYGKFIVEKSPAIAAFAQNGFLSLLDSPSPPRWVNYDIRAPISVKSTSRILLKVPEITDCFELDLEIAQLPAGPTPTSASLRAHSESSQPVNPTVDSENIAVIDVPASPESVAEAKQEKRFPLRYTCDMKDGLAALAAVKGKARTTVFAKHFPNLKYSSGTVYKHLVFYRDALKYGILTKFSEHGRTEKGLWYDLIGDIERRKASEPPPIVVDLTEGRASAEIEEILDDGNEGNTIVFDDNVAFKIVLMKMSHYMFIDGVFQAYCNSPPIDVFIFDDLVSGGKFEVHMGNITFEGHNPVAIAVKYLTGQEDVAVWTEGARSSNLHALWESFKSSCKAQDILLTNVEVVATSLLSDEESEGAYRIAQPWHFGHRFKASDLVDVAEDVWNTLSAFSHYTYQMSNHNSVYVDFEGILTAAGYRILDSVTHVSNTEENFGGGGNYLGCLGKPGVKAFQDTHNCNATCGALSLNSIPLAFPDALLMANTGGTL